MSLATLAGPLSECVLTEMEGKALSGNYLPAILVTVLQPKPNSYSTERIDKILTSRRKRGKEEKNPSFLLQVSRLSAENCSRMLCCVTQVSITNPSDFKLQQLTKADHIKVPTQMSLDPSDDNSM